MAGGFSSTWRADDTVVSQPWYRCECEMGVRVRLGGDDENRADWNYHVPKHPRLPQRQHWHAVGRVSRLTGGRWWKGNQPLHDLASSTGSTGVGIPYEGQSNRLA